ncbi:hypothetical protein FRC09_014227 [Ceratobasidium sp. 395]|nr:hypothetical protein FRC09_014227 [Ceratobasidium sp. 395]
MSRFHIYAPSIKNLDVDSPYGESLEVHDWESLILYAQTTQLLPNLVVFHGSQRDLWPCLLFLSGSTQTIRIFQDTDSFGNIPTSKILGHIANQCPNIFRLEFYCQLEEPTNGDYLEDALLQMFTPLSMGFQNLHHIMSNTLILQPDALRRLAQLPNLTNIWAQAEPDTLPWNSSSCGQLPPDSFPALKSLSLDLETCRDVRRFWELVPLANLETATVSIASTNEIENEFIQTLCRASPNTKSLRLAFPRQDGLDEEDDQIHMIPLDMFEHLARLALKDMFSLSLAKLNFDDGWVRIAAAWPSLREIDCLRQPMRLDQLLLLSISLPNLYRVQCDLDLEHAARAVERNWQPSGDAPSFPSLCYLTIKTYHLREHASSYHYDLSDLARFFAYFWPNINVQSKEAYSGNPESLTRKYNQALFDMFQKLIRAHVQSFQ